LSIYLEQLDRAAYIKSYQRAGKGLDTIATAEEGMTDYFQQLEDLDNESE